MILKTSDAHFMGAESLFGEAVLDKPAYPLTIAIIGTASRKMIVAMAKTMKYAASSLSGFALHAAKQTADAVWLENEYYKETSER